jgi:aminopeptidase N
LDRLAATPSFEKPAEIRLEEYRPTDYAITTVSLLVQLDPHDTRVTANITFHRRPNVLPSTALTLAGDELDLVSVEIDGVVVRPDDYRASPDELTLLSPPTAPFTLTLLTRIAPEANTKLMGLYRSSGNYCTQCEAEGFRRITYFLDRPDVLAVYTTRIEAEKSEAPYLLANGNLIERGDIPGTTRHFAVWNDPFPKPSYLFALVAGDFARISDQFVTMSGRSVALEIYVEHGRENRAVYAMDSLKRSMAWDETAFGREYDLDVFMIVAVSDFNMGAMENKGLNVFNDKYVLADQATATDVDFAQIEAVIAHEYFHNWTGNRITCRDWFQLCLKEGLTVFRDQEFSSDMRSRSVKRISDVRLLKSHQFPEDAGPLAHPVRPTKYSEINNFYTATVYEKGAEVIRMLKRLIGSDGFARGLTLYFDRHDGEAATMEDFIACFEDTIGSPLTQFMLWYHQSGTPQLTIKRAYDAASQTFTLTVTQTCPPTPGQPTKEPMVIPLALGLVGPDGADLVPKAVTGARLAPPELGSTTLTLIIERGTHTVSFTGLDTEPTPSLLRGFSAPVRLDADLTIAEHLFLLADDADPFNRWQAAQTVAMAGLVEATNAIRAGRAAVIDPRLIDALGHTAADESLDHAFRALVLTMPGETDIAREIGSDVDPDAIHVARTQMRRAIATGCKSRFEALLATLADSGPYTPDAASAGRRSLKNMLADYLAETGDPVATARIERAFADADNMTDRIAALTTLVSTNAASAPAALADFYDRFAGDSLVIDKWFAVQAMAPLPDTLERVRALTQHAAFSVSNPNRFRALVTTFATGNQSQFNRPDGAGYRFVADWGIELDQRNPQVASRLLSAFRSWRALEPGRRAHAEAALRSIAARNALSTDVADIVARCLS